MRVFQMHFVDRTVTLTIVREPYGAPTVPILLLCIMIIATLLLCLSMLSQIRQTQKLKASHARALEEQDRRVRAEHESKLKTAFLSNSMFLLFLSARTHTHTYTHTYACGQASTSRASG